MRVARPASEAVGEQEDGPAVQAGLDALGEHVRQGPMTFVPVRQVRVLDVQDERDVSDQRPTLPP